MGVEAAGKVSGYVICNVETGKKAEVGGSV